MDIIKAHLLCPGQIAMFSHIFKISPKVKLIIIPSEILLPEMVIWHNLLTEQTKLQLLCLGRGGGRDGHIWPPGTVPRQVCQSIKLAYTNNPLPTQGLIILGVCRCLSAGEKLFLFSYWFWNQINYHKNYWKLRKIVLWMAEWYMFNCYLTDVQNEKQVWVSTQEMFMREGQDQKL